jgi:hypothetical protein
LKPGVQFVVLGDRDVVILKVIQAPDLAEFDELNARAQGREASRPQEEGRRRSRRARSRPEVKVVVDTNVAVSGFFFDGIPGRILSAWP